jgi:hypothetical protein
MNAIEQADALQQQAIELLLAERERIDQRLAQLKKDPISVKKRGRPAKSSQLFQPDTTESSEPSAR